MDDMNEEFVDIQNTKKVYIVKEDIDYIKDNPEHLTKEGCMEHLKNWDRCKNVYVKAKYRVMLAKCDKFVPSGKTVDGGIILSRGKDGKPNWVKKGE